MTGILLTQSTTPIIGQAAWLLGLIMDWIFIGLDTVFGIQNIGVSIIVFTIVVYLCMTPLNINQQRSQKLTAVIQPEVKKIQEKYKGKKDQLSLQKQQEEIKVVYDKYGASQTGGCLQLLIQMPILFGLYQVIRNIPAYVTSLKDIYTPLAEEIMAMDGYEEVMTTIGEAAPIYVDADKYDYGLTNTIIDVLYKLQTDTWAQVTDAFPSLDTLIISTRENVSHINSFLGLDIADSPLSIIQENYQTNMLIAFTALMIPLLAGLSQFISLRIAQSGQASQLDDDNPMASSLKTMNTTMPLLSVFMCFSFSSGLGIYWIASAVVRTIQQRIIAVYLNRQSVDEIIEKNKEKAAEKREKRGIKASKLNEMAQQNAKSIESKKSSSMSDKDKEELRKKAAERTNNAKPGSLAAKANMVSDYNKGSK